MYIKRGYAWRVESNPLSKQHVRLSKIDVGASNVQWVLEIPVYNQNIYQIRVNLKRKIATYKVYYVGFEFRKHLASIWTNKKRVLICFQGKFLNYTATVDKRLVQEKAICN